MPIRKAIPKPHGGQEVRRERARLIERDQEPVRTLLGQLAASQEVSVNVRHVAPAELVDPQQTEEEHDQEEEDPHDSLGLQDLFDDCRHTTERLLDQCECSSRNPLHSTATESELPKPGNEYKLVNNLLGVKDLSVTSCAPGKRLIKEPDIVQSHAVKATHV